MALVKPVIQPTNSYGTIVFDATQQFIVTFVAQYSLTGGILTNGKTYQAKIAAKESGFSSGKQYDKAKYIYENGSEELIRE